ncbi:MAG: FkbM family methyltransferase [Clostridiaceae bacterium]|nr:FkbM family methyltransferase [Clostridiaceae bacterium]
MECIEYLNGCTNGRYSSAAQWDGLLKQAKEAFSYGLSHEFVICGNSEIGRQAQQIIENNYGVKVVLADGDQIEDEIAKNQARTFILASRKFASVYSAMLDENTIRLNYNHLWMLDRRFERNGIPFQNSCYIQERLYDTVLHADTFLEMMDALEDQLSKELLARILLYRVTLNERYSIGVKSKWMPYFDEELLSLSEDTVFVDAGGFNGDTLRDFLKITGQKFEHYYFFEPVPALLDAARKDVNDKRIDFLAYGLWDKDEMVSFGETAGNDMAGHIVEEKNGIQIQAVSLDHYLDGKRVSFIKMDIEGAETAALYGAKQTIKKYHPVLAVSAYHKADDLIRIYEFCKFIGGYHFYLRTTEENLDYDFIFYAFGDKDKVKRDEK